MTAEKAGVPAVGIMTDRFTQTARAMAKASGMPDYPFVVIPHPISNNPDAEIRAKAEEAVRQGVGLLLKR
ncbi:MAG TPA: hypothetical protein VHL09_17630 [Dehalococcoidia bacterium]|nr:hypothetical protein [Dehalococcoidia bacterium]